MPLQAGGEHAGGEVVPGGGPVSVARKVERLVRAVAEVVEQVDERRRLGGGERLQPVDERGVGQDSRVPAEAALVQDGPAARRP